MSTSARARAGRGRSFWIGLVLGWAAIAFGILSLLSHAGATHPIVFGLYVVGSALAHDLVLVPLTLAFMALVAPRLPVRLRGPVTGASVVSAVVVLFAIPALAGFGRLPDNPSLLPRNYVGGLAAVLAAVWVVAGLVVLARLAGNRRARGAGTVPPSRAAR
ncbi:MAG TPA: hypothetical protein VE646_05105 [Actinomycetota bacterium]|jgi:hypothetical protein|nr:hypothetical protein [Actinomycetota bacterium]